MIISRTPFRISLFGGGADYPSWYRKYGGRILGTSIDKYCYISCRYLPAFFDHKYRIVYSRVESTRKISEIQHPAVRAVLGGMSFTDGVEIHHDGDLPAKSGLGSSSAFTVGLINALTTLRQHILSKRELSEHAIHYERDVLKEHVGSQDQILTAYGGLNVVEFNEDDSFDVSPLILPKKRLQELNAHMMLFFTGSTRIASHIARSHINNLEPHRRDIQIMQQMVGEGIELLQGNNSLTHFGRLLDENWEFKKKSTNGKVTTKEIDHIYTETKRAGAIGGKILGAGGGGFMLVFAQPDRHSNIKKKLKLTHVPFKFESKGSKIAVYEPED